MSGFSPASVSSIAYIFHCMENLNCFVFSETPKYYELVQLSPLKKIAICWTVFCEIIGVVTFVEMGWAVTSEMNMLLRIHYGVVLMPFLEWNVQCYFFLKIWYNFPFLNYIIQMSKEGQYYGDMTTEWPGACRILWWYVLPGVMQWVLSRSIGQYHTSFGVIWYTCDQKVKVPLNPVLNIWIIL